MLRIFTVILGMSFTGGALLLLFLPLSPLLRRCFSALWYRNALCVLLAFFAAPAGLLVRPVVDAVLTSHTMASLPYMGDVPEPLANLIITQAANDPAAQNILRENLPILFAVLWLCVAAVLLAHKMIAFVRFSRGLEASIRPVEDERILLIHRQILREMGIKKNIGLYQSSCAATPMIVGLARTAVILPDMEWTHEELALVLRHELTHCRHRDLLVKWVGAVLCAMHWFNPCIWLLTRRLERWMELACDAGVVRDMDLTQRRVYGNAIISVSGRALPEAGRGICAAFCESKQNMKERLTVMLNTKRPTKKIWVFSVLALALLCVAGVLIGAAAHKPEAKAVSDKQNSVVEEDMPEVAPNNNQVTVAEEDEEAGEAVDFIWPADGGDYISEGFFSYAGHTGIDIPRPIDTDIYASAAGIITKALNTNVGYGKYIVIDHGNGYQTLYAHCGELLSEVGDEVEAGEVIAKVGRSGNTSGYKLHFEIRYNGEVLDPEPYVGSSGH